MSSWRLCVYGFLLLLSSAVITAQDGTTVVPLDAPAEEGTATDAAVSAPDPEAATAAAEESLPVVSDAVTEPADDVLGISTQPAPIASDAPTAPVASPQTTKDVVSSTTVAAVEASDEVTTAPVVPVPAAEGVHITSSIPDMVPAKSTVSLRCVNPSGADLEWVFSGPEGEDIIKNETPFMINISKNVEMISSLSIEHIALENTGDYTCRAVDDAADKATVTLNVIELDEADEEITEATTAEIEGTVVEEHTTASAYRTTVTETEEPGVPCRGDLCDDEAATSTMKITEITTVPPSTVVQPVVTPVVNPCVDYKSVGGSHFTLEKPNSDVHCFGLFDSPSGWIKFHLKNEEDVAEIPTVPMKQDYCGVHFAFHVHLQGKELPEANQTETAEICSYLKGEVDQPCANNKIVEIHNCNDEFFVYKFTEALRVEKLCDNKGGADVCLKRPGETIPDKYRSDIILTTTRVPQTTQAVPDYGLPRMEDLTEEQANGTITIEYNMPEEADPDNCTGFWVGIDKTFRQMIADALNVYLIKPQEAEVTLTILTTVAKEEVSTRESTTKTTVARTSTPPPTEPAEFIDFEEVLETEIEKTEPIFEEPPEGPQASDNIDDDAGKGPSKREAKEPDREKEDNKSDDDQHKYTKDDVFYVYDTPICVEGLIQVAIIVQKTGESNRTKRSASGGHVVPQNELDKAVSGIGKEAHQENTGLEYVQHYQGQPREPEPKSGAVGADQMSIWDAHMGLFIAVIVLLIICLIVIIIGILCIKCKGRQQSKPEKTPLHAEEGKSSTVIENPISDDEITKGEAPMTEAPNPAYTPNGSGQHLTKGDEDNGWIVPLDELSYAERERPEVENTKL